MIIETILGDLEEMQIRGLAIDRILLGHYDLTKPHQKLTSEDGSVYAVSLPHGQQLFCGAVIYKDDSKLVVIDLLPEDVLEVRPKGNLEWGKAAFNIGNMHHPAYLHEDCILLPYDSIIEKLMKGIGVPCMRRCCKLTGVRAPHAAHWGHSYE